MTSGPGTSVIPAVSWLLSLLSLLALKLTGTRRVSHVDDLLTDPASALFAGLATAGEAVFDLDFHAVMPWGHDPVLEKHYVPTRSQRARSVLTFFPQDTGTRNLVYANADLSKAAQAREPIAFCDSRPGTSSGSAGGPVHRPHRPGPSSCSWRLGHLPWADGRAPCWFIGTVF